jgi:hypothetical protein
VTIKPKAQLFDDGAISRGDTEQLIVVAEFSGERELLTLFEL